MAASIKLKFIPSKIQNKKGVISLQLIRNRKVKLIRTRFRLFPDEWDKQREVIIFGSSDFERQSYLQSVKIGLDVELKQLAELIRLLETKGDYTVDELVELHATNSFNGNFFSFANYVIKNLKTDNRQKTATILQTAKTSFQHFWVVS